jgi:transposase, IS6 family
MCYLIPISENNYEREVILQNVRWYLKYLVSYRNSEETMIEREIEVDHTILMR